MATKPLPSPELLRKLLNYDPETGALTWRKRDAAQFKGKYSERVCAAWNSRFAGKPLTQLNDNGYIVVSVNQRIMRAHRVAWAIYYGSWPSAQIDHVNHDRTDNRLENLRAVNHFENARNLSLRHDSQSGVTGVSWIAARQRWYASIWANGRTKNLGFHKSKDDAIAARKRAEAEFGFHRNHGQSPIQNEIARLLRQPVISGGEE